MDKIIARRWVDELRSGKHTQRTGTLCKFGAECCLGVLSDVIKDDPRIKAVGWTWEVSDSRGRWIWDDGAYDCALEEENELPQRCRDSHWYASRR